jgi:site-specific DNA-methyltransferase (cytosine-N4-specific)
MSTFTRSAILLPLLETLSESGGAAKPADLYDRVAEKLAIPDEARNETREYGGKKSRLWDREVRWARQQAILRGLMATPTRGQWEITEKGNDMLRFARPGVVVTIFETDNGAALWASAENAAAHIEAGSVDLIFTSPPYPVATPRRYGGIEPDAWVDWMARLSGSWAPLLSPTGSLMVNLGYTYQRGTPTQSIYPEEFAVRMVRELGWNLCDRLFWHNPHKLPSPMPWVAIRRVRCKQSIEPIFWFARTPNPKADNRRVLQPYSETTLRKEIGRKKAPIDRESGYDFGAGSFARDNGGSIPPNLIVASNSSSTHHKKSRASGLPSHPATFPMALPERAILLTTEPGDVVYDPFGGSGTTAAAAEKHGRRWITSDRALAYVEGAALRFEEVRGFRRVAAEAGAGA